jgi:hypothetical protein
MKEGEYMKVLKVDDGKGLFLNGKNEYVQIDEIGKDDLMLLVNMTLNEEITMDEFSAENIKNQAHQIIYKSIYEKIKALNENKNGFKDESDRKYLDAIKRYSIPSEPNE